MSPFRENTSPLFGASEEAFDAFVTDDGKVADVTALVDVIQKHELWAGLKFAALPAAIELLFDAAYTNLAPARAAAILAAFFTPGLRGYHAEHFVEGGVLAQRGCFGDKLRQLG